MAEQRRRRRTRTRTDPAAADPQATGRGRSRDPDTMLRGLVAPGPSALSPVAAMRARDVARPTAADLARAGRELVVVRRNYRPPAEGNGGSSPVRS